MPRMRQKLTRPHKTAWAAGDVTPSDYPSTTLPQTNEREIGMKGRDLLWFLQAYGCSVLKIENGHARIRSMERRETTVPLMGVSIPRGTIRAIEDDLGLSIEGRRVQW